MDEIWRDIESATKYKVSNLGRIKTVRYLKTTHVVMEKIILPYLNENGYLKVKIISDSGIRLNQRVHRLVIESFYGKKELSVNHKNNNKLDNRLENLEYLSIKENIRHYHNGVKAGMFHKKKRGRKVLKNENGQAEIGLIPDQKYYKKLSIHLWQII